MSVNGQIPATVNNPYNTSFSLYALTKAELTQFCNEINTETFLNNMTRLFSNPSDFIYSIRWYPFESASYFVAPIVNTPIIAGSFTMSTKCTFLGMSTPNPIPMGTVQLSKYFNTFMDYAPYTVVKIWLPFIGFCDLDTNLIMGGAVTVKYYVDYVTGQCTANVSTGADSNLVYTGDGAIGIDVPIGGGNRNDLIIRMATLSINSISRAFSTASSIMGSMEVNAKRKKPVNGPSHSAVVGQIGGLISSSSDLINIGTESGFRGTGGTGTTMTYLPDTPYLLVTRPKPAIPQTFNSLYGRLSMKSATLSSLTGFTKVAEVHVEGSDFSGATAGEMGEIERLLKEGVIL